MTRIIHILRNFIMFTSITAQEEKKNQKFSASFKKRKDRLVTFKSVKTVLLNDQGNGKIYVSEKKMGLVAL